MRATYIPDRITVYDPERLAAALRQACSKVTGKTPPDAAICVLMAQIALETGRGKAAHDWNLGNIKCSSTYMGFFTCFRCNEIIHGKVEWFSPDTGGFSVPPGHPQTRFRAYREMISGVLDYVAFLARPTSRYRSAWLCALTGDATGYVHELRRRGYFTADETRYRLGVVSLVNTYKAAVDKSHELDHPDLTGIDHRVDNSTVHSPMSDEDLADMIQLLQLDPDWAAMQDERNKAIDENGGV